MAAPNQIWSPYKTKQQELAEKEYIKYIGMIGPLQQRLGIGKVMAAQLLTNPKIGIPILQSLGVKTGLKTLERGFGIAGAAVNIGPSVLSELRKSKEAAYTKQFRTQLGGVGAASGIFDNLMTLQYIQLIGKTVGLGKNTPDLTALLGKGIGKGYGAATKMLSKSFIGKGLASAAKQGGMTGMAAGAVQGAGGLLGKGIGTVLNNPMGVQLVLTGLQMGLAIAKSIKLAKITPTRQAPDKYARKLYNPSQSSTQVNRVLALSTSGKVDPATLSFMIQQIQLSELQRLNMQLAGLRGEYHSENDFRAQQREKGGAAFSGAYGREIMGEEDRSVISQLLDTIDKSLTTFKTKFDPFTQLTTFAVGLLHGKMIMPKQEIDKIAGMYGYKDQVKMMKDKAAFHGMAMDQTRLLHTPGKSVVGMGSTHEAKMLGILTASYDMQRIIAAEVATIRLSGFGIAQNILYRKEPGAFKQFMSDMFDKLNPMNLPGINALWNIAKGGVKTLKFMAEAPNKIFQGGLKALRGAREATFGSAYGRLKDKDELAKAAGLHIPLQEKAQDFIANGLPEQIERIRSILFDIYYVQDEMLSHFGGKVTRKDEMGVWSPTERRYLSQEAARVLEESQKAALLTVKEQAFRSGPLGKLLYLKDILATDVGKGFFKRLEKSQTVVESIRRMRRAEKVISRAEILLTGEPETFMAERAAAAVLQDVSGIKTRKIQRPVSLKEIESERQLKRVPSSAKWAGGAVGASAAMGALPILLGIPGVIGSITIGAVYAELRRRREKQIKEEREKEIKSRTDVERVIETAEEYYNKRGMGTRVEERGTMGRPSAMMGEVAKVPSFMEMTQETNERLKTIASYLGKSETSNVYSLLSPKTQDIAEIAIAVTRRGKKIPGSNIFDMESYRMKKAAAKGALSTIGNAAYTVGEKGMEVVIPSVGSTILPNSMAAYMEEMIAKIEAVRQATTVTANIEVEQSKAAAEDARQMTFFEKMKELKDKMKEKAQENWQKQVTDLLGAIKEKGKGILSKDGKKEGGGILSSIWDFVKGNLGKILGGLLATLIGGYALSKIDFVGLLKTAAEFANDQLKGMSAVGRIATFAIGGAGIGLMFGGPVGLLTGALLGGAIGGVIDSIYDMIAGYKEGGILGGFDSFFSGSMPGEVASVGGNAAKFAGIGAGIGFIAGGPLGALTGALMGGAIGGAIAMFKNMIIGGLEAGEKGGIMAGISTFLTGSPPDEFASIGGNAGKFALLGAAIGIPFGGPVGMLVGALIGGVIGAALALLQNLFKAIGDFDPIEKIKQKVREKFPKLFDVLFPGAAANMDKENKANAGVDLASIYQGAKRGEIKDVQGNIVSAKQIKSEVDQMKSQGLSDQNIATIISKKYPNSPAVASSYSTTVPATPAGTPGGTPASTTATGPDIKFPEIPATPGSIQEILQKASATTGVPLDIMTKMAYAESAFNPNAKAKTSSASGLFQFISDTWHKITSSKGKKYGITPGTSPFNASANALMGGEFIKENMDAIKGSALNSPPNAADVYAAHFMGAGGANKLFKEIRSNPNAIAANLFPKQAAANTGIFYKNGDRSQPRTVSEVYQVLAKKMSTDPSTALAKAGTEPGKGLLARAGEAISSGVGSAVAAAKSAVGPEGSKKARNIMEILATAGGKIETTMMDALNSYDTTKTSTQAITGQNFNPGQANVDMKNLTVEQREQQAKIATVIKRQENEKEKEKKEAIKVAQKAEDKVTASTVPKTVAVKRGAFGTEVSNSFRLLELDIFKSLNDALMANVTSYPFESNMHHST